MDPDPNTDPEMPTKNKFKNFFPAYYFLKVLLHHFSKIKSKKKVTKLEIKVFLIILNDRRIRIQEAQKRGYGGSGSGSDPDPQL